MVKVRRESKYERPKVKNEVSINGFEEANASSYECQNMVLDQEIK